jgi:hypothetical protein
MVSSACWTTCLARPNLSPIYPVVLSNRLVTSPCAIVADSYGYSANMERLMGELTVRLDLNARI